MMILVETIRFHRKETLKSALQRKKSTMKSRIGKIDEGDETTDVEDHSRKKASTANKKKRAGGGGHKKRPQTVQAQFVSTAPMVEASIMDLEQKFATLGFSSDNDGDDESELARRTPAWHDTINWGHSSPLGNELYGNSFDDNNRPSVSRANVWGSMDGAEIGEFAMSLSLDDGFPAITPSVQVDIDEKIDRHLQLMEQRAMTASTAVSTRAKKGGNGKKSTPLTSASMVDLHGGDLSAAEFIRPNTASQFPSWHYED